MEVVTFVTFISCIQHGGLLIAYVCSRHLWILLTLQLILSWRYFSLYSSITQSRNSYLCFLPCCSSQHMNLLCFLLPCFCLLTHRRRLSTHVCTTFSWCHRPPCLCNGFWGQGKCLWTPLVRPRFYLFFLSHSFTHSSMNVQPMWEQQTTRHPRYLTLLATPMCLPWFEPSKRVVLASQKQLVFVNFYCIEVNL